MSVELMNAYPLYSNDDNPGQDGKSMVAISFQFVDDLTDQLNVKVDSLVTQFSGAQQGHDFNQDSETFLALNQNGFLSTAGFSSNLQKDIPSYGSETFNIRRIFLVMEVKRLIFAQEIFKSEECIW